MSGEKDKINMASNLKHVPKDAQVIMSIMKELNVPDYEPRVVNQLLEFVYRYITCVMDDAKVFANHARKKVIDLEDVKLATDAVADKAFTAPPPRHVLAKLAEIRNSMPLPAIKPHCGLRLPPDRYCLTACNYKLRSTHAPKRMAKSAVEGRSQIKSHLKGASSGTGIKRSPAVPPKTQVVTVSKPTSKFTTTPKTVNSSVRSDTGTNESTTAGSNISVDIKTEMDVDLPSTSGSSQSVSDSLSAGMDQISNLKREREDDFELI